VRVNPILVGKFDPATAVAYEHAYGHEIPMALIRDKELQRTLSEFFDKL